MGKGARVGKGDYQLEEPKQTSSPQSVQQQQQHQQQCQPHPRVPWWSHAAPWFIGRQKRGEGDAAATTASTDADGDTGMAATAGAKAARVDLKRPSDEKETGSAAAAIAVDKRVLLERVVLPALAGHRKLQRLFGEAADSLEALRTLEAEAEPEEVEEEEQDNRR